MRQLEFVRMGMGSAAMAYADAWAVQRRVHESRVADAAPDTVLLLEHLPVYTAGKRTQPHERPLDGTPVVDVDRGGKITWHGPGQLVGYPIVQLPDHVFVVDYIRRLEEALIRACAEVGVCSGRVPGRSGVWVPAGRARPERKIAAIGVRMARGVTMHGFALNCDCDLGWFDRIVPCGIDDATVTSLSVELGRAVSVAEVIPPVERHLSELLSWTPFDRSPDVPRCPEPATPDIAPAGSTRAFTPTVTLVGRHAGASRS